MFLFTATYIKKTEFGNIVTSFITYLLLYKIRK